MSILTQLDESDQKLVETDFQYEPTNTFTCPGQQVLVMIRQGEARMINTDDKEPLRQDMNRKMAEDQAKAILPKTESLRRAGIRPNQKLGLPRF